MLGAVAHVERLRGSTSAAPPQALVLDANQRSALAVTRSLGRAGYSVAVAESSVSSVCSRSRYANQERTYPHPARFPNEFRQWLQELGRTCPGVVLFACSDLTLPPSQAANDNQGNSPRFATCWPTQFAYESLSDKWSLYLLGQRFGIPVPLTHALRIGEDAGSSAWSGRYPVIVKPRRSVQSVAGQLVKLSVSGARSPRELDERLRELPIDSDVLIQESVTGAGFGISAVCDRGNPVAWFAHRRIRELPPSGGVSTLCESIAIPSRYQRHCLALIEATTWHGPVMFEFKGDPDGAAVLIEVNGRLWGSLQLAIHCGVDVPRIMFALAVGNRVVPAGSYAVGKRMRWLMGDLSHLYLVARRKRVPEPAPGRWQTAKRILLDCDKSRSTEDWAYGDAGPFWMQLRQEFRISKRPAE